MIVDEKEYLALKKLAERAALAVVFIKRISGGGSKVGQLLEEALNELDEVLGDS